MRLAKYAAVIAMAGLVLPVAVSAEETAAAPRTDRVVFCNLGVESVTNAGRFVTTLKASHPEPDYGISLSDLESRITRYLGSRGEDLGNGITCGRWQLGEFFPYLYRDENAVPQEGIFQYRTGDFRVSLLTLPDGWGRPDWDGTERAVRPLATETKRETIDPTPAWAESNGGAADLVADEEDRTGSPAAVATPAHAKRVSPAAPAPAVVEVGGATEATDTTDATDAERAEAAARQRALFDAQLAKSEDDRRRQEAETAEWQAQVDEAERQRREYRAEICKLYGTGCGTD